MPRPFDSRHSLEKALDSAIAKAIETNRQGLFLKLCITNLPTIITWYDFAFASRLMSALHTVLNETLPHCIILRTHMEEFDVIIADASDMDKQELSRNLHRQVQEFTFESFTLPLRLSAVIGTVSFPHPASVAEEAISQAYIALSSAKNQPGVFYCDYADAEKQQLCAKNQAMLLHYLQDAVQNNKLKLAFQPIVCSKTGQVTFYECLLRIVSDDGKVSSAGMLIPIAEKMGFVDVLDKLVLEKVIEELGLNPDITLSFNISNLSTDSPEWLAMCREKLKDSGVASRVIVEITETAAQRDLRETAYFVASLQELGCRVALDDFCAGYTSFRQLKSLSVDMIKIDGAFTRDLVDNSDNRLFVKTLLDFTTAYGLKTIAECVETGEGAKILMELQVDYLQGYYFGRPELRRPWKKNVK